jgi:hypothetical protein
VFNLTFYQRHKDGKTPVQSINDLYEAAALALPQFEQMLHDIADELEFDVTVKLSPSGLKARERTLKKSTDDYSDRPCDGSGGPFGWVYDIVRGTFMCESATTVKQVVERLVADPRVKVVLKFKNRFKNPTPSGFCDMMLQIVFAAGSVVHVCEVQVHLRPIYEFDAAHASHRAFEYFRDFFGGSMKTVAARLKDMDTIVGPGFVAADEEIPINVVLAQLVVDVVESLDITRMNQAAMLCREYLQLFTLAGYIFNAVLMAVIGTHGEDHYAAGGAYHNVGLVLDDQGKHNEALGIYQKALLIQVKTLGQDHPDVGSTHNSAAGAFAVQSRYDEAVACYQKALAICVQACGEDAAEVGAIYNNMANAFKAQKKHDQTLHCFQKAAAITEKALGADDAEVGTTLYNFGFTWARRASTTRH